MTQRLRLGGEMAMVDEDEGGIRVTGPIRLCPGRDVDVITPDALARDPAPRRAIVWNWRLTRVGSEGPIYEGYCRWS